MTESKQMNVYFTDTGATYYILAHTPEEAAETLRDLWREEGWSEGDIESEDGFTTTEVPRADWPEEYWDDGEGLHQSFAKLVGQQNGPTVLTCSEY